MDALLPALLACLLCEIGGGNQMLSLALAERFARDGALIAGISLAAITNAALSAAGGWFISLLIAQDARSLFLALALMLGGAGLLMPIRRPDLLEKWRIGPFLTASLGVFILGFGDSAQFIIMGLSNHTADPIFAAVGGAIGTMIACISVVILRQPILSHRTARWLRRIGGGILLSIGAIMALSAIRLL